MLPLMFFYNLNNNYIDLNIGRKIRENKKIKIEKKKKRFKINKLFVYATLNSFF